MYFFFLVEFLTQFKNVLDSNKPPYRKFDSIGIGSLEGADRLVWHLFDHDLDPVKL